MPMWNLLEYSDNYSMTSGSLWNYYRDAVNDSANENNDANNFRINDNKTTIKSFACKTKLIGSTPNNVNTLDAKVVVPLKYLNNFWRSFDLSLINCDLSWSGYCVISEISKTSRTFGNPPTQQMATTTSSAAGFTLCILNEDMNDIIKIIKSLEDSGVLIDGVTETVKHEKKTRRRISWSFVSTFSRFNNATSNFFSSKKYNWKRG